MTHHQNIDFIRYHGVVLEAAKRLEPTLASHIAGGPIKDSWWGHPMGQKIYEFTQKIAASNAVLVCRLARGKITYVHRRLWQPFVRLSGRFPNHALDKVLIVHLSTGRHQRQDIPFPKWVPEDVLLAAKSISVADATPQIQVWLQRYGIDK